MTRIKSVIVPLRTAAHAGAQPRQTVVEGGKRVLAVFEYVHQLRLEDFNLAPGAVNMMTHVLYRRVA